MKAGKTTGCIYVTYHLEITYGHGFGVSKVFRAIPCGNDLGLAQKIKKVLYQYAPYKYLRIRNTRPPKKYYVDYKGEHFFEPNYYFSSLRLEEYKEILES